MWSLCDSLHAIAIYALDTNWKATTTVCTVVFASDFLLLPPPPVAVAENSNIVHEDEARNAIL